MQNNLLNYAAPGTIIGALVTVVIKLYADNKAKDTKLNEISQARVDDLKAIATTQAAANEKIATMVSFIYNKLESEKKGQ